MNNLNTLNLKETIISTLQEILQENPHFFLPNQLNILTWKSKKIAGALITKIGNQRYLGLVRKDSQGQEYWRYQPLKNSHPEQSGESSAIPPDSSNQFEQGTVSSEPNPSDKITKFQQRQEKVKDYVNNSNFGKE